MSDRHPARWAAGLKTLVQLQSTRQLGEHASATLATTWQPDLGFGMQLGTARQLSTHWHGEGNWVVGPRVASGLGVGLTRRDENSAFSCKLDVRPCRGTTLPPGWQYLRDSDNVSGGTPCCLAGKCSASARFAGVCYHRTSCASSQMMWRT